MQQIKQLGDPGLVRFHGIFHLGSPSAGIGVVSSSLRKATQHAGPPCRWPKVEKILYLNVFKTNIKALNVILLGFAAAKKNLSSLLRRGRLLE
jgi:hypothetical protein